MGAVLVGPGGRVEVDNELGAPLRQMLPPELPVSVTVVGPQAGLVLVAVGPAERLRLLRNAGHCDPALVAGTYPVATLKLGTLTLWSDKLEPGLPWSETVNFEGALGDDLTFDLTTTASVFLNLRYELF
jgi:hypothetical protein